MGVENERTGSVCFNEYGDKYYHLAMRAEFCERYDCYQEAISSAIFYYKKAAELGHEGALNTLGFCYKNGIGVAKNLNHAVIFFGLAAKKDNEEALKNLKNLYIYGKREIKQDVLELLKVFLGEDIGRCPENFKKFAFNIIEKDSKARGVVLDAKSKKPKLKSNKFLRFLLVKFRGRHSELEDSRISSTIDSITSSALNSLDTPQPLGTSPSRE
jgi:TPR repeat protein